MLWRLIPLTRTSCPVCGEGFRRGLGYGVWGASSCSARCRRVQLCATVLPRVVSLEPTVLEPDARWGDEEWRTRSA